jgi:hypothetical protein
MTICLRLTVALLTLQLASSSPAAKAPRFTWWVAGSLAKVKPLDPLPESPVKSADLSAGRNEFEPFQIVIRPEGKDATGLDLDCSDLRTSQGAGISKDNVTAYFEPYINLVRSSSGDGTAGLWPDALIPRVDRYAHEKRNAFPFDVRRDSNQPLWIEVFVPETAQPGKYTGTVRITRGSEVLFTVPIRLTVWSFTLPSTSSLKSSFGLSGTALLKQHRGRYTSDEDLYALTRVYAKAALQHRISVHGGSMAPPKYQQETGRVQLDWRAYDAEVGPFLDGTAIPDGEPLHGARATSIDLRTPGSFQSEDQQVSYLDAWVRHFQQRGWLDRLFLYLWDEPNRELFPKVLQRGRLSLRTDPPVRNLVTVPYTSELESVVQIWVPLVNCLERKPGFDDFCAAAPALEAYSRAAQPGKSLWFYQSCASHGCNHAGGEYFKGWPSYMIDTPAAGNRVMQWIAWKYKIEGELYFSMNEAYGHSPDPWTDVRLFGGNGDGTLFYPGKPARIGGATDIPIESIRLKLIREGMEDYEYLALLAKLGGQEAAAKFSDRIVTKPYQWESNPERFLKVREEMGEALDRLAASRPANRGDGR